MTTAILAGRQGNSDNGVEVSRIDLYKFRLYEDNSFTTYERDRPKPKPRAGNTTTIKTTTAGLMLNETFKKIPVPVSELLLKLNVKLHNYQTGKVD